MTFEVKNQFSLILRTMCNSCIRRVADVREDSRLPRGFLIGGSRIKSCGLSGHMRLSTILMGQISPLLQLGRV